MSNDVQSHEDVEHADGANRRGSVRHAAGSLGSVTARIIGGSPVELVNFSNRGILFECDSRLLIGARASVRITTTDANLVVTGRVVRSRVKGLVNGALRYDAALALDAELSLSPAILAAVPAATDDMVSFETDVEDPSPVEAYVAESEASLLEVSSTDLPIEDAVASVAVELSAERPVEPEAAIAADTEAEVVFDAVDTVVEAAEPAAEPVAEPTAEAVAFEADGDIAFEPAVEFAFDEAEALAFEPAATEEPAGSSMFDSTYIPQVHEVEYGGESQFEVTPPTPVQAQPSSSFFDSRPSEAYGAAMAAGEAPAVPAFTAMARTDVALLEAAPVEAGSVDVPSAEAEVIEPAAVEGAIEFESEVAFEAEDAVMFEAAFDEPTFAGDEAGTLQAIDVTVAVSFEPVSDAADVAAGAAAPAPVVEAAVEAVPVEAALVEEIPVAAALDEPVAPAPGPVTEDRVLLQFAASVPHDLAELRRIAADNQW